MPVLSSLDTLTGAAFIGFVISVAIYGITCLQAIMYYNEYSAGDRTFLKGFVGFLVFLDTLQVALVAHALYWYLVTNFGNILELVHITWSLIIQLGIAQLLAICVQNFFAWRVYLLSERKNIWIPAIVVLCGAGLLASTIGFMVTSFRHRYFTDNAANIPWSIAGTCCELAADAAIMTSMTYYLIQARTGFDRTHKILNTLLLYTLNTCLLTTIFAVLTLAVFTHFHNTLLYAPFYFVFCRIYACSFLSTLNTRRFLREGGINMSTTQESIPFSDLSESRRACAPGREPIIFTVTQDTFPDDGTFSVKGTKTQV